MDKDGFMGVWTEKLIAVLRYLLKTENTPYKGDCHHSEGGGGNPNTLKVKSNIWWWLLFHFV